MKSTFALGARLALFVTFTPIFVGFLVTEAAIRRLKQRRA